MSYMAFMAEADKALAGKFWGTKFPDRDNVLKDTGVQELVEELLRILQSVGPIPLHRPLEFINYTNGPAIDIYNAGTTDWKAVRVQDGNGNMAQFGIGLGSQNITANNFVPHPRASLDPFDMNRFYSDKGGNANAIATHPQAIFAGNGLVGLASHINNFQVPFWNWFDQPQYINDGCHSYYTWNMVGQAAVILPEYVPQAASEVSLKFSLGIASASHDIDEKVDYSLAETSANCGVQAVSPTVTISNVCNKFFGCIEAGDVALIAEPVCQETRIGDPIVVSAPLKRSFATATALQDIDLGGSGQVRIDETTTVTATSPFCSIPVGVTVAIDRDTGLSCGSWVITAATCSPAATTATSTLTSTTLMSPDADGFSDPPPDADEVYVMEPVTTP